MTHILSLDGSDWQLKGYEGMDWIWRGAHRPGHRGRRAWLPAAVPGSVQHDLWRAGEIPDLYTGRNTLLAEWVPQRTWLYRKSFVVGHEHRDRRIRLCFDAVDYEAEFFLNGEPLGTHRGMFTPAMFEIGGNGGGLRFGEENTLAVVIHPAPPEQPQVSRTALVRTTKTRMSYWWDFSPRVVHLGIWGSARLEITGPVRIEDVWVRPHLNGSLDHAVVTVETALSSTQALTAPVDVALHDDHGRTVAVHRVETRLSAGDNRLLAALEVPRPHLWWPNGEGAQPLYRASVHVGLPDAAAPSDERSVSFGIRRLDLAPNDTPAAARAYTLVVNGRRIYLNGWNWVPMDVLYGVPRPDKLEQLLTLARRAHVNLLRVWGGGLIETEAFYTMCDRLGMLVWQEFIQSSSGIENVPADDPEFIAHLAAEAAQIVPLRRNHPSLAVWCGGNELTSAAGAPLDESHPAIGALQAAVAAHDPGRPWLPTSPSGPEFGNSLEAIARDPLGMHDVHGPWEHQGLAGQFALYNQGASLLHSEFGVEGLANSRTLDAVIPTEQQWPVSLANPYWFHLGAWWVKEEPWRAMGGELSAVDALVRATQFLQADGLRYAVEADRRRQWQNSGTLPWQFNEPYPMAACTSAVDYYTRPKPAYYAVAAAYAPVRVSARFDRQAWAGFSHFEAQIWTSNALPAARPAVLDARLLGPDGRVYAARRENVTCPAGASVPLHALGLDLAAVDGDVFFLDLRLSAPAGGAILSRNCYVFSRADTLAPLFAVPPTTLAVTAETEGNAWTIQVANTGPAVALLIWIEDARALAAPGHVFLDDNYFSLFPGESRTLTADWHSVAPGERRLTIQAWNTPVSMLV